MSKGEKKCPSCGFHIYHGSYKGTPVYKCANPMVNCEWNQQWHEDHSDDEYRTPLGTTIAQVRRVNAEFGDK